MKSSLANAYANLILVLNIIWRRLARRRTTVMLAVALFLTAGTASAALISYSISSIGSGLYRYDYVITAEIGDADIRQFALYFDEGAFSAISSVASPLGWDTLVIQPDSALASDGIFDSLAVVRPIAGGETLGGFSASFQYGGNGIPAQQRFEIIDPDTFTVLASGWTRLADPNVIPLPASAYLMLAALIAVAVSRRRQGGMSS